MNLSVASIAKRPLVNRAQQALDRGLKNAVYNPKSLANGIAAFSFLAPAGNAIFRPILLNREYKRKGRPDAERKMLVSQEAIGQTINLLLHWSSFIATLLFARKFFTSARYPGIRPEAQASLQALAGSIGSFLGMSFLCPVVSGKLLNKLSTKNQAQGPQAQPNLPPTQQAQQGQPQAAPVQPSVAQPRAFQNFAAQRFTAQA